MGAPASSRLSVESPTCRPRGSAGVDRGLLFAEVAGCPPPGEAGWGAGAGFLTALPAESSHRAPLPQGWAWSPELLTWLEPGSSRGPASPSPSLQDATPNPRCDCPRCSPGPACSGQGQRQGRRRARAPDVLRSKGNKKQSFFGDAGQDHAAGCPRASDGGLARAPGSQGALADRHLPRESPRSLAAWPLEHGPAGGWMGLT